MNCIVVARGRNLVIGDGHGLLWDIPEDLEYFKSVTDGKTVIMGRKTYESIGRALPNRLNIVISRTRRANDNGIIWVKSIEEALLLTEGDNYIIGGGAVYAEVLEKGYIDRIYVSEIDSDYQGDVLFEFPEDKWEMVSCDEYVAKNGLKIYNKVYDRL